MLFFYSITYFPKYRVYFYQIHLWLVNSFSRQFHFFIPQFKTYISYQTALNHLKSKFWKSLIILLFLEKTELNWNNFVFVLIYGIKMVRSSFQVTSKGNESTKTIFMNWKYYLLLLYFIHLSNYACLRVNNFELSFHYNIKIFTMPLRWKNLIFPTRAKKNQSTE